MAIVINNSMEKTLGATEIEDKYLGTTYILNHKADFEPGRSSDFILKIKFQRDLYDIFGYSPKPRVFCIIL